MNLINRTDAHDGKKSYQRQEKSTDLTTWKKGIQLKHVKCLIQKLF